MGNIYNIAVTISESLTGLTLSGTKRWTAAGGNADVRQIEIATTETTVTLEAGIGDAHMVVIKNTDTRYSVEISFVTSPPSYALKLYPGDFAVLPVAADTSALYMKADGASVFVSLYATEL